MNIAGYEVHPAANLFPMIEGDEFIALVESIRSNGLRDPVVLVDGEILDGRNRAHACLMAGVPIKTIDFVGGDPWDYVWDKNAERRHLAQGTKGAIWVVKEERKTAERVKAEADRKRSEAARGNDNAKRDRENSSGSREPRLSVSKASKVAQEGAKKSGVSPATIKRAIELKKKAPERFAQVAEGKAELNKELREVKREEKHQAIAKQAEEMPAIGEVRPCPVVYADPPWQYGNTAGTSAAEDHYPTMPLADICALDVPATKDAVLFLWATSPLLPEAFEVICAWGFTYKASMVWDKSHGTGNWVLNAHELLLIAVRGDIPCPAPSNRPVSIIREPVGRHSAKPEAFAQAIERMFPGLPKVEMFARKARDGWTVWGNQAA